MIIYASLKPAAFKKRPKASLPSSVHLYTPRILQNSGKYKTHLLLEDLLCIISRDPDSPALILGKKFLLPSLHACLWHR